MFLDFDTLAKQPAAHQPFPYLVMTDLIRVEHQTQVMADFPALQGAGLYTPDEVAVQGHFAKVMDELMGKDFESLMSKAFGLDLSKYPKVYTIRGFTRAKDGNIHTDSTSKIVTVLVYFNENPWPHPDGRLRLLKSGSDLNDIIQEVSPSCGTLIAFKRTDNSWHGHPPFVGARRAIQLNWVTSEWVVKKDELRHKLSAKVKALKHALKR